MVNAWLDHVKNYRSQNPNMSYSDALVEAKKTYKSSNSSTSSSKKVKKSKKSRKSKKSDNNNDTNINNSMEENTKNTKNTKEENKQKTSNKKRKSGSNPWIEHVKQFRKENPNLSYTEALVEAKKTYKK